LRRSPRFSSELWSMDSETPQLHFSGKISRCLRARHPCLWEPQLKVLWFAYQSRKASCQNHSNRRYRSGLHLQAAFQIHREFSAAIGKNGKALCAARLTCRMLATRRFRGGSTVQPSFRSNSNCNTAGNLRSGAWS
jgi:adenine-specific DNA methylase